MKIVIMGAGDMARMADYYFSHDSKHSVAAFCVDGEFRRENTHLSRPLVDFATVEKRYPPSEFGMFVAMSYGGMNELRAAKVAEARSKGYRLVSYVSSRCTFLTENALGMNCLVLEDNTIQPFVVIGNDVFLWSGNHIGHDVVIEDHCFIASHVVLSGHVHVEKFCFLGVNASIGPGVRLGQSTLVGAGAVVLADTKPRSVLVPPRSFTVDKPSTDVELP